MSSVGTITTDSHSESLSKYQTVDAGLERNPNDVPFINNSNSQNKKYVQTVNSDTNVDAASTFEFVNLERYVTAHLNLNNLNEDAILYDPLDVNIKQGEELIKLVELILIEHNYHAKEKVAVANLKKPTFGDPNFKTYSCKICCKQFLQNNSYLNHIKKHPVIKETYTCTYCGKLYYLKEDFNMHIKFHEEFIEKKSRQCLVCGKTCKSKLHLSKHMACHDKEDRYTCTKCEKVFRSNHGLKNHVKQHDTRPFQCYVCKKLFTLQKNCLHHVKMHGEEKAYQCSLCGMYYNHLSTLTNHMKNVHNYLRVSKNKYTDGMEIIKGSNLKMSANQKGNEKVATEVHISNN